MNKFGVIVALAICFVTVSATTCDLKHEEHFQNLEFTDIQPSCIAMTEKQIEKEITASLKYLHFAAYFTRDDVNRPGFAKFFFDAASEEREHAEKLIEYLAMRGQNFEKQGSHMNSLKLGELIKNAGKARSLGLTGDWLEKPEDHKSAVSAGLGSLQTALKMEYAVTKSIRDLIITCEKEYNDYHFVDYLTAEFLTEQYHGKRDLAGKISTLGKMVKNNGAELADFLFDKKLQ